MNTEPRQTEAQRLADALETWPNIRVDLKASAALLRRQDELLGRALEALLITCAGNTEGKGIDAIKAIRALKGKQ